MRHLFLIDPLDQLNFQGDTSLELMRAASALNNKVAYGHIWDLSVSEGKPHVVAKLVDVCGELGQPIVNHSGVRKINAGEFDVVWLRVDPPVNESYLFMLYWAELLPKKVKVLNHPKAVASNNEKLLATRFQALMPRTLVLADINEILRSITSFPGGKVIVKPVDGYAGKGIILLKKGNPTNKSLLELVTDGGRRPVVIQEFLPNVKEGDVRVLLVGGEYLGSVLRIPPKGDIRSNLAVGGHAAQADLTDNIKHTIKTLKPFLKEQGLFFTGIDLIGCYLTEVNFTSPTGLVAASKLSGKNLGQVVLTKIQY